MALVSDSIVINNPEVPAKEMSTQEIKEMQDAYGGSTENRARFAAEILRAIRQAGGGV